MAEDSSSVVSALGDMAHGESTDTGESGDGDGLPPMPSAQDGGTTDSSEDTPDENATPAERASDSKLLGGGGPDYSSSSPGGPGGPGTDPNATPSDASLGDLLADDDGEKADDEREVKAEAGPPRRKRGRKVGTTGARTYRAMLRDQRGADKEEEAQRYQGILKDPAQRAQMMRDRKKDIAEKRALEAKDDHAEQEGLKDCAQWKVLLHGVEASGDGNDTVEAITRIMDGKEHAVPKGSDVLLDELYHHKVVPNAKTLTQAAGKTGLSISKYKKLLGLISSIGRKGVHLGQTAFLSRLRRETLGPDAKKRGFVCLG